MFNNFRIQNTSARYAEEIGKFGSMKRLSRTDPFPRSNTQVKSRSSKTLVKTFPVDTIVRLCQEKAPCDQTRLLHTTFWTRGDSVRLLRSSWQSGQPFTTRVIFNKEESSMPELDGEYCDYRWHWIHRFDESREFWTLPNMPITPSAQTASTRSHDRL